MSDLLQFEGIVLPFIERDGERWLRMVQLAPILGYKYGRGIGRLYLEHRDWFRDEETTLFLVDTVKGQKATRAFSFRGAWRLSFLANTDYAKRFQIWALDIIEREQEDRDTRLADAKAHVEELRQLVLTAKPVWSKISRFWDMGYSIEKIATLIAMPDAKTQRLCDSLEETGVLLPRPAGPGTFPCADYRNLQPCLNLGGPTDA